VKLFRFLAQIPFRKVLAVAWPMSGIALVSVGAWQVYQPAGLITAGGLILFDTIHGSRRGKPK
jgi:hypothetical protein